MTILSWRDYAGQRHFEADVVVVGTGAGGAVAGAELAEAGLSVLFVEEGGYHPTRSFNPYLTESVPRLYRDGGTTAVLGTPVIPYIEGRCVGGSTTLNGGMTYRPPEKVLEEWERQTGDPAFGPRGLEPLFERVERAVSACAQLEASVGDDNRLMAAGAKRLGWRYSPNHRNQRACTGTNNCVFGCPSGAKQSTLVSYVPRALERGALLLTELRADGLIIEGGRAAGIRARSVHPLTRRPDHRVEVRARAVVVAAGAIQTPYLLLRHRLGRPSGQLGRNLLLHPNVKVTAVYPFPVKGWQGVSQGGQIRQFHDEGIVLAENMIPPGALGGHLPGHGQESWELMSAYSRLVVSGALVEDSTSGRVRRGPFGMPLASYAITDHDYARFKRGTRLLAEMHFAMGAERIILPFSNEHYAGSMDEVDRALARQRRHADLELFTVHLMGTARLGSDPRGSVVGLDGALWDLPGAYVADASLFPTAIGVNPQITIMALATHVAQRLADRLGQARRAA